MNTHERYKIMRRESDVFHGITRALYAAWQRRERRKRYNAYMQSAEWQIVRATVIQRSRGRCEAVGCKRTARTVHHDRYPRNIFDTRPSDCRALCVTHHRAADAKRKAGR